MVSAAEYFRMPEVPTGNPLYWPITALRQAYASGKLSPEDVLRSAYARLKVYNPELHAFLCTLEDLAFEQAAAARKAYRDGVAEPLAGIPISIKDTFDVAGAVSTRGSLIYRSNVATLDSGAVRRLRAAGAVFVGKTNTAEFGQSATTDNRLGEECRNPWDLNCTPGGSTGGGAASVAAGIVVAALGADGGGSLRIPAAFSGLVGFKPTFGLVQDEGGFRAMSDFCCAGPLAWRVADAREMLSVLAERSLVRGVVKGPLRVAWCPRPEGRPVDPELSLQAAAAARKLASLGYELEESPLPIAGWNNVFGPLVLEEEGRLRGHLLTSHRDSLTDYERATLEAAAELDAGTVEAARQDFRAFQMRMDAFFETYDLIVTPTTSVPAFRVGQRPQSIAGERVDSLWGAFPFTAAFNVAGTPGASIPCGFVRGMPVGLQLVCGRGRDAELLNIAEDLEEALAIDLSTVIGRFSEQRETESLT
jgi:Asp-tRNA(Asn)/Glu-tRNA(Gln) amidotransferase A subunit family amidase